MEVEALEMRFKDDLAAKVSFDQILDTISTPYALFL